MYAISFIAAIGAFQGTVILLSILLRFRHRKNLPLALLLTVFSLRLVTIPTWREHILLSYPWIYPMTAPLPFLFGPFLWWYIRELVSDKLNTPKPLFTHFLPYIFEVLAISFTLITKNSKEYGQFIHDVFSGNPPVWLPVRNSLKIVLNIIYLAISGHIAFSKKTARVSEAKRLWLRLLVIIPSVVLISFSSVAVLPSVTERLSREAATPFFILSVTMLLLIYGISFLLLISPDIAVWETKHDEGQTNQLCSDIECKYLLDKVEKRFSEGAYQNPDLTLLDLATEFNVNPNRLSYAINHCLNISFRTLLNARRLDYFFSRIEQNAFRKHSILELAFEAGFPSKSTFNRVFKEKTGIPPSEYVRQSEIS